MMVASSWRLAAAVGLGLGVAGLFWSQLSGPFPLADYCTRPPRTWILPLFERPRHSGVGAQTFILVLALAGLAYLAALRLVASTSALRGRLAVFLLIGLVPLVAAVVLVPGYPLLSGDIFKYIFGGRILAVYGENPFLHVPAEFPRDPFYEMVAWKTHVNAHGPIWRVAESASALVGGESCAGAVLAMKIWPTLAYFGTIATLFLLLRAWAPERALWGTMLYAWNPLVMLESLLSGHNDVVAALPALLAVWATLQGRLRWTFPLLALAGLVKPLAFALGPFLLVVALRRSVGSRRDVLLSLGLGGAIVLLAYAPFWEGPATLQGLARGALFTASPARLLQIVLREEMGLSLDRSRAIAGAVASVLFLLLLGRLLLATWQRRLPVLAGAVGVFLLYLLVGAQWFNPWYLLWAAPLAALVPETPPRVLLIAFTLLAPLVYPLNATVPIVLTIFVPMLLLALYWRTWLGWPGPARSVEPDRSELRPAAARPVRARERGWGIGWG